MKKCSKCGAVKPYSEFYKNCKAGDGLTYYCQACHKVIQADQYGKNRDNLLLNARLKRQANPDQAKLDNLAYREKNRDKLRYVSERYRRRRPEQGKAHYRVAWALRDRIRDGYCFHHWNYAEDLDIFELSNSDHMRVHANLKYDEELWMYRTLGGDLLDTRKKHEAHIRSVIKNYSKLDSDFAVTL